MYLRTVFLSYSYMKLQTMLPEFIKRRLKVHEKNMSRERA